MNDASNLPPAATPASPPLTRRDLLRWISLSAASGVVACGGGGDASVPTGSEPGPVPGPVSGPVPGPAPAPAPGPVVIDPTEPKAAFSKAGKGVPGTAVSPAQRAAALDALNAKLNQLYDSTRGIASPAGALAWLEQQDAYQTIGFSATGNVYAVFTDGRPLIVGTNTRIDANGVSDGPPRTAAAFNAANRRRTQAAARAPNVKLSQDSTEFEAGIPSKQFRYLNTWASLGDSSPAGVWCRPGLSAMSDIEEAGGFMRDFGYEPIGGVRAFDGNAAAKTVEALKNVKGDGVFFWSTHGGTLDLGGNIIQGLMTGTVAYQSTVEDTYKDEFAEGTLIYYSGVLCFHQTACGIDSGHHTRLAITPKFIRKYGWSFGEHSLVFVNACASATGDMKQAFLDAGASVYLGWTKPVRLWAMCGAAYDFFSLMLGLNENTGGVGQGNSINPLQRPYDWAAVMTHLQSRTQAAYYLDADEGIVELEPTLNEAVPAGFQSLRPSIYWTAFDEARSEMILIGGVFGTRRGSAAIGAGMPCLGGIVACTSNGSNADWRVADATTLAVKDWRSQNVVLKLPADGPGSAGIVQVEVDGRWSNGVQLTRVNFPLKANKNFGGSLSVQVNAKLSFRGDFRGVRLDPVQALTYMPLIACSTPPVATATFTATGVHRYSAGDSGGTVTVEWSGSGVVGPFMLGASGVAVTGTVTPQSRTGALLATIFGTGIQEKTTVSIPGFAPRVTIRSIGFEIATGVNPEGGRTITVPFSAAYAADATIQSHTVARASPYNSADLATRIELGPFTAEYPPQEWLGGR